jgi:glutaminyl-tRNA synthetase
VPIDPSHRTDQRETAAAAPGDFIREIVEADLKSGKYASVVTRFPPEPNGYLHIGHAKSICLNFGLAEHYGGRCHLRFDDSNPTTEDEEYVASIQNDVRWLGFDWGEHLHYASDYFGKLHDYAAQLIRSGKAYVCSLNEQQIREYRGTITEPGRPSPYRERSVEENLDLFRRMRAGEFADGAHVLRAKIDMASANMKMRDPLLYRIRHAHHYRTGDAWCMYPLYDFTHCLSDSIEGITHSICTLEFENNRDLYDWILDAVEIPEPRPHQYEFARLSLNYTVMSKRKLLELVEGDFVSGWDDPRMPTIAGLRRRGVTPQAIRAFAERVGVAKHNSTVDMALFEHVEREDLNLRSPRVLGVLQPLKVVIENFPERGVEELDAPYWPEDVPKAGSRKLPFSRVLYVERDDFAEQPPKGWHRLAPGREVRLRHAYIVECTGAVRDERSGEVVELRCRYDPATKSGQRDGRKVKGTLHWVSAEHAIDATVRVYDRLFSAEAPGGEERDFKLDLNPDSLVEYAAKLEPSLALSEPGEHYQLERLGFFFVDASSKPGAPILSRVVALKDTWKKIAARSADNAPAHGAPRGDKAEARPGKPAELAPKARQLVDAFGIGAEQARVLATDAALRALFDATLGAGAPAKAAARFVVGELPPLLGASTARLRFGGRELAELIALAESAKISGPVAKQVLAELVQSGGSPASIVRERGLEQIDDAAALGPLVDRVLAENADAVERYRAGNANLMGAFVGMVMRQSGGKANPKLVGQLLRDKLG